MRPLAAQVSDLRHRRATSRSADSVLARSISLRRSSALLGVVRLKRGAGAGCTTPSTSTNVPRAFEVRMLAAPRDQSSTGATQASVCSNSAAHSSRAFVLNLVGQHGLGPRPVRRVVLRSELGGVDLEDLQQLARRTCSRSGRPRASCRRRTRTRRRSASRNPSCCVPRFGLQHAGGVHAEERRRERGGAVDDRRIDDLSLAGLRVLR